MNVILSATDVDPTRIEAVRAAARRFGSRELEERTHERAWIAVGDDGGTAVHKSSNGSEMFAAYGSGSRVLNGDFGSTEALLDGLDDDLVATAVDNDGRVTVATGRGNHRMFATTFPEGGTMVSSHLGLLAAARGDDLRMDRSAEDFLLGFGFLPDARTPFDGIDVVAPGTRRTLAPHDPTGRKGGNVETVEPPPTQLESTVGIGFDAAVDEVYQRFTAALEEQAGDDTRHAVFLGGFDSALVAATLRRMGHQVDTFTFGFGDPRYEQNAAAELSAEIGAEHCWVHIEPDPMFDAIESFATLFPQPGPQPHYQVHTLLGSAAMREQGHTHAFSGDGCDATFLGYPMVNTRAKLLERLSSVPTPMVRAGLRALSTQVADRRLGHVARMGRSVLGNLLLEMPARGHLPTRYLDALALERVRMDTAPPQTETVEAIRRRLAEPLADLDRVRLAFHGSGMVGQSRAKVDGAVATTGVTQRSPYLHPDLRAFVTSLPVEFMRPSGSRAGSTGKLLLAEMARRYRLLPDRIIDLPKQSPVDSPVDAWYSGRLRPRVVSLLDHLPFALDRSYLEEILAPKRAEDLFRERVSLGHHALAAVGLLCSYASFCALADRATAAGSSR